jgi:SAM-dependent methyltransferase
MTHAQDFSAMQRASARVPIWYWNRQALLKLRQAIRSYLTDARITGGASVVELGCGNRAYEHIVRDCGARYVGADLEGNSHADLIIGSDGCLPVPAAQFDAVLSTQVLEHVENPAAYLAEARRVLRPGGALILSTHGVWEYHPSPGDYWRWTGSGLRKLLEEQQFRVELFSGVLGPLPMALQLAQDTIRRRIPGFLRKPFCLVMQWLIAATDRLHSNAIRERDAMIFVVLARPVIADQRGSGS